MMKEEKQTLNKIIQSNIIYSLDDKEHTATVVGLYCFGNEELLIPSSIIHKSEEYIVTKIDEFAFHDSEFKFAHFAPDSKIKIIENNAFNNSLIESIIIPSSLTELKKGWCNETKNLINIFVNPNNPRYKVYENKFIIGKSIIEQDNYDVLVFCVRNIETVTIPDFIVKINQSAFDECVNLCHIQFSNNSKLKTIENSAFSCSLIESISIPASTIDIFDGWCEQTAKLTKITVMPNNPRYSVYDEKYLLGKSSLDKDCYDTLLFCVRDIKEALIPDFIEIIGSHAFDECYCMKSIRFLGESKLQIIKKCAFFGCNFKTISIPASVQKINIWAFRSCKSLLHIDIPINSKLKIIEESAFMNSSLEDIFIPSSLTELKEGWCRDIKNLNQITIDPNNQCYLVYDGKYLLGKSSLEKENYDVLLFCIRNVEKAIIPDFIEKIDPYAFEYCQNLEIEISTDSKLRTIGTNSFHYSSIKSIYIPSSVIEINESAFHSCRKLKNVDIGNDSNLKILDAGAFFYTSIKKITIPSCLQKIGRCAFGDCYKLKCVIIPENSELKLIENEAFRSTSIESFSVPPHLIKIENGAFHSCKNLKEFVIPENAELQKIGNRAFYGTMIQSLLIPPCLTELEEGWCENIPQLYEIDVLPNNPCYSLHSDSYIIEKSSFNSLIFCVRNIFNAIIPDFIEIISPYSFNDCKHLQYLKIPSNSKLKIIDKYAFTGSSIESIIIPSQLEEIKESAFSDCNSFTSIFIPFDSRLKKIEKFAFCNTSINSFFIPPQLINLNILWSFGAEKFINIKIMEENPRYMIYDNKLLLEKSSIEQENYDILNWACRDIVDGIIPNSIEVIEQNAFDRCNMLQQISFSSQSKLKTIEKYAFNGSSIECITIPSNLVELKIGWCSNTPKLICFTVMPRNKNFINLENNFILGKTNPNDIDFNFLIFARRNIKNCKIPSFITKIGPYSFNCCSQLEQICFSSESKLNGIDQCAFWYSSITSFCAPPHLYKIDDFAFNSCQKLQHFYFPTNSDLEIIGVNSFSFTSIQSIFIPSHVKTIGDNAFASCHNLQIIEISENSELEELNEKMFSNCNNVLFMIPSKFDV